MPARWFAPAVLAAGVLIAVAGCESSTPGNGTALPTGDAAAAGPGGGSGHPTDPTGASSAPAPPSAPSAPAAADGSDVTACADARCEVSVRAGTAIPVPASTDVADVTVTAVTDDRVTLTGRVLGSSSGGLCTGQCDSRSSNGEFTVTLGPDSLATQNGLSITSESITNDTAVLKLAPVT